MIPSRVSVEGRDQPADSFSFAILRAYAPEVYSALTQGDGQGGKSKEFLIRFGSFRDEQAFGKVSFSAREVLAGKSEALRRLEHRVVLLGGRWHRDGLGVGPWTDEHLTPVGRIVGVYTHANYVEALRVGEYYPQISETWTISLEVLLILGASIVLALDLRKSYQIAATILPSLLIMILSYVVLQNLGFFFESVIPLFVLVVHHFAEHLEWRTAD